MCSCIHIHMHVKLMHIKIAMCLKFLLFFWQILKNALIKCYLSSLKEERLQ